MKIIRLIEQPNTQTLAAKNIFSSILAIGEMKLLLGGNDKLQKIGCSSGTTYLTCTQSTGYNECMQYVSCKID